MAQEEKRDLPCCPCCGGPAETIFDCDEDGDEFAFVECQNCGLRTPGFYSYKGEPYGWEKAEACWSKRITEKK